MALQSSGQISLSDIASEFGGSTPHSLSEYYGKGGVTSSGQISLSDFYGTQALSVSYLGKITDIADGIWSGSINMSSVANGDVVVGCCHVETIEAAQTYTVAGVNLTSQIQRTPSGTMYAGTYIGARVATSGTTFGTGVIGQSSVTCAQTYNYTSGNSFRGGGAYFKVSGLGSATPSATASAQQSNAASTVSTSISVTSGQIVLVIAHMSNGGGHTLSTSSGTLSQYSLADETVGMGAAGLIQGASGTVTVTMTNGGTNNTQGDSICLATYG